MYSSVLLDSRVKPGEKYHSREFGQWKHPADTGALGQAASCAVRIKPTFAGSSGIPLQRANAVFDTRPERSTARLVSCEGGHVDRDSPMLLRLAAASRDRRPHARCCMPLHRVSA